MPNVCVKNIFVFVFLSNYYLTEKGMISANMNGPLCMSHYMKLRQFDNHTCEYIDLIELCFFQISHRFNVSAPYV